MPAYDRARFEPPAPVAMVTVRDPTTGRTSDGVAMLIDTGADVTLLPASAAEALGLAADEGTQYELVGLNDSTFRSASVSAEILLLGKTFRGLFLLTPNEQGIVGRNVLNHLALILDGPHLEWREAG